jgi:hypothetical protein
VLLQHRLVHDHRLEVVETLRQHDVEARRDGVRCVRGTALRSSPCSTCSCGRRSDTDRRRGGDSTSASRWRDRGTDRTAVRVRSGGSVDSTAPRASSVHRVTCGGSRRAASR